MSSTTSLEGAKKAVFFPFGAKNWGVKWLIGSALTLGNYFLPIVSMIPLYGYLGQIAKGVIQRDEDPELPEWNDFGLFFSDGIKIVGAILIFALPGFLALFTGYILMFAMNFRFMFNPQFFRDPSQVMPGAFVGSMVGVFAGMLVMFLGFLLTAVAGLFMSPALGHQIAKGEFGAAFRVKEWWPIFKVNFSGYILSLAITYGVYMVLIWAAYLLYFTVVLCVLMPFVLCVIIFLMAAIHLSLIGVTYRDGVRLLAEAK